MAFWCVESNNAVVIASYDNPPMNYFCAQGAQELGALIEQWRGDAAVRAIVLCGSGAGNGFITHYSVEELLGYASDPEAMRAMGTSLNRGYHGLLLALRDLPKVVIVAMNGNTMGGGFELSLAADIRVGQNSDVRYGLPEVRLGIIPGGSGTQRLARLIGAGRAIEFVLRSRIVAPAEALAMGLVHEVADDAVARARQIAAEVAALPPLSIAAAKRAIYAGSDTHLAAGSEMESAWFFETMLSNDARLAMQTYVDLPFEQRRGWLERSDYPAYAGN
ncbi:MAG: enoyl-CoA hydratase/isomerase family protein [Salinisphaera sp.]|nr:enoyl-CoA hydratase/isomerase family protein [Salinisphaera sp.]